MQVEIRRTDHQGHQGAATGNPVGLCLTFCRRCRRAGGQQEKDGGSKGEAKRHGSGKQ